MRRFDGDVPLAGPFLGILLLALVTAALSIAGLVLAAIIAWMF